MDDLKETLRKMAYNSDWDGTCGTCGNSCAYHPKYGNMRNMKRTYCGSIVKAYYPSTFNKILMMKNSTPKWCPRKLKLKEYGINL